MQHATCDVAGNSTLFLVDQMRSVDVNYIKGEPVDYLHHDDLAVVEHTVSRYLGLTSAWSVGSPRT